MLLSKYLMVNFSSVVQLVIIILCNQLLPMGKKLLNDAYLEYVKKEKNKKKISPLWMSLKLCTIIYTMFDTQIPKLYLYRIVSIDLHIASCKIILLPIISEMGKD